MKLIAVKSVTDNPIECPTWCKKTSTRCPGRICFVVVELFCRRRIEDDDVVCQICTKVRLSKQVSKSLELYQ